MRAEISPNKIRPNVNAFLVSVVNIPKVPEGIEFAEHFTNRALVAINDVDGNEKYSGVFLVEKEKEIIYKELNGWDCAENEWHWCNLYEIKEKTA